MSSPFHQFINSIALSDLNFTVNFALAVGIAVVMQTSQSPVLFWDYTIDPYSSATSTKRTSGPSPAPANNTHMPPSHMPRANAPALLHTGLTTMCVKAW